MDQVDSARWTDRAFDRVSMVLLVLVSALALVNLRAFPPFVDEGISLWWVLRIVENGEWLRPLRDGKPLEGWLAAPLVHLGGDPLATMRVLHVIAGMVTVLLVYLIGRRVTTRGTALAAAVLTAISPFLVLFERMAIIEAYMCVAGAFVLLSVLRFWQAPGWSAAITVGISLVVGAFARFPTGFIFLAVMPLALICMSSKDRSRFLNRETGLKLLVAYLPVAVLALVVAAVALVQSRRGELPGFGLYLVFAKTQPGDRWAAFTSNAVGLLGGFPTVLTWPVVILGAVGIALSLWRGSSFHRWLAIWGIAPVLGMVLVPGDWNSRYYLFAIPALTVSAVCGWRSLLQPGSRVRALVADAVLAIAVVVMGQQSTLLILDPPSANWSASSGYVGGWTSGYGFTELASYLQSSASTPPRVYAFDVGTAMQLRAQLPREWSERVQQIQIVDGRALSPEERQAYLLTRAPAWLASPFELDDHDGYVATHLRRVAAFGKPVSDVKVTLYEVLAR